jgi:hypothetical protein
MNIPKGKPWSKAEVEKLRGLLKIEQSLEVVAAKLK